MNESEIVKSLGKRVRLRYQQLAGENEPGIHAEGQLIAYADEPTVAILTDEGLHVSWLARLVELVPESPDCPHGYNLHLDCPGCASRIALLKEHGL